MILLALSIRFEEKTAQRDRFVAGVTTIAQKLDVCKSIGLSVHQQYRYLKGHRDLHPETKKIMRVERNRPTV